jgi:hypothetical protein
MVATDGSTAYDYTALDQQGNGFAALGGAGSCGVSLIATFDLSGPLLFGPAHQGCALAIPGSDVRAGGPSTASAITVDGQNAYLPYAVEHFLINQLALTVTQSPLTVTKTIFPSGDIRVTESSTLMKCSASNAYPPTSVSCPSLVSTHVIFKRVADLFRGAHQIRFRDSYTSSDGVAHAVAVQYETQFASPPTGSMGYTFPGHSQTFARVGAGTSVSSFGPRAGTMQVRSNMYAADDDLTADTHGITWSRPPSKAQFGSDLDLFALNYSVEVPAAGGAYLGFATSEAPLTAAVRPLAAIARAEMVSTPVITSPKNKATIRGTKTTVKGKVARGANGLAKSVVINGHKAKLTTTSTGVIYAVTFHEKIGRHTIKVVATDAVGNTASKSVKVRNKRKT